MLVKAIDDRQMLRLAAVCNAQIFYEYLELGEASRADKSRPYFVFYDFEIHSDVRRGFAQRGGRSIEEFK
ncbi:hypothetical protein TELCIR_20344, partial [Teladorsagia circumcincta]